MSGISNLARCRYEYIPTAQSIILKSTQKYKKNILDISVRLHIISCLHFHVTSRQLEIISSYVYIFRQQVKRMATLYKFEYLNIVWRLATAVFTSDGTNILFKPAIFLAFFKCYHIK